ncbi:MAG: helix-turn-helix domain-containing protein, partial [Chloroflexota bacterium]
MGTQQDLPLPAAAPSETIHVNERCTVRREGDQRVVLVAGLPFHHYATTDVVAAAYARVMLVESGYATQREVARAFGRSDRSIRRELVRYRADGMAALATRSGWRSGRRRIASRRLRVIERLRAEGMSNCEIARRLGVSENAIRKQVGAAPPVAPQQLSLQGMPAAPSAPSPPETEPSPPTPTSSTELASKPEATPDSSLDALPASLSSGAHDRTGDRIAACFGLLQDAAPVFADATAVAGAGVLCAVPLLVASDIFRIAHRLYGEIGPAFYG